MYGKLGSTALAAGAPSAALAWTGLPLLWLVVSAMTFLAAGFALLRLIPRATR
jgi:hypothetical protein